MSEHEAVESLETLGLTRYEAKVFIALHRLGTGSARDIARDSDVPRPQVYSTAESLEELGLIDVQQSDPIQYKPVPIEQAKVTLTGRLESARESAFEYIETVRRENPKKGEERANIWTLSGPETITKRIVHLIREAERDILFSVQSAELVDAEIEEALREAAEHDMSVRILARDQAMASLFDKTDGITVVPPSIDDQAEPTGRLVVVDGDTVLLSAFGAGQEEETAIWSEETAFARVVIRLIQSYLKADV